MKDSRLDFLLHATRPRSQHSPFTQHVMEQLVADGHSRKKAKKRAAWLAGFMHQHKMASALGVVIATCLLFTTYSYAAEQTDPLTLIRRWVVGDTVQIETQGHKLQHGTNRSYSDAAVSAYVEDQLVDELHFYAVNDLQRTDGKHEHMTGYGLPLNPDSWLGTVEKLDGDNLYIRKQFIAGFKLQAPLYFDELVTVSRANFRFYNKGELTPDATVATGKLVKVFEDYVFRYETGSNRTPKIIKYSTVFSLSYPLSAFKEVGSRTPEDIQSPNPKDLTLVGFDFGAISTICMNSGADSCPHVLDTNDLPSLYPGSRGSNPGAIAFGEAVPSESDQPKGIIMRQVEGPITAMDDGTITIKSSSGQLWKFAYTKAQRTTIANTGQKPLYQGDVIYAAFLESLSNLENRSVATKYIYNLWRVK